MRARVSLMASAVLADTCLAQMPTRTASHCRPRLECEELVQVISGGSSWIFLMELLVLVFGVLWLISWIHGKNKK